MKASTTHAQFTYSHRQPFEQTARPVFVRNISIHARRFDSTLSIFNKNHARVLATFLLQQFSFFTSQCSGHVSKKRVIAMSSSVPEPV